jgi:hypothetical protein
MRRSSFKTVSDDLLEYAEEAATDFENRGFRVKIEQDELGCPYTPTLLCKRQSTTIIVEVFSHILPEKIDNWVAYARSSGKDTRIAVCLPPETRVTPKIDQALRTTGVGLYTATGNGNLIEIIPPRDLALNIALPPLTTLPKKLKELLGHAYEQFDRSQWREGFEDACQTLENAARRHFKAGCRSGRITLVRRSGPYVPGPREIDKMTMGQLANAFSQIQSPTYADQIVGQALTKINRDRVGVVHRKSMIRTENRLRKYVGQHMWTIIAAMKQLV